MPEELKLLDEWTTRLGLKDWFIILETNVDPEKMPLQNADGCVSYEEVIKSAKIQIINPDEIKNDNTNIILRPFDFEETLVHELLHIKFCLLECGEDWEKDLQLRLLHQIIDDIARALVESKRTKVKKDGKKEK